MIAIIRFITLFKSSLSPLLIIVSIILIYIFSGCGITYQTDTNTLDIETQKNQTSLMPTITTTSQGIFLVSDLYIVPTMILAHDNITVTVTATNTGTIQRVYNAVLNIIQLQGSSEIPIASLVKNTTINSGASEVITFDQIHLPEGEYKFLIDRLSHIIRIT